ncbi:putative per-hexamer repeat protein 5 [Anastrepha ludens]|uniref:putative per-hexamer repeat protein 5 n=1 Tax=Anastrepha ludens TaxID=28586 RepID=UPI0023B053CB|nr:putative per-hexamer repeat protein 5 [Anastrepha ludens]
MSKVPPHYGDSVNNIFFRTVRVVQFRIAPLTEKIPKSSGTTTLQRLKAKAAGGSVKRSRTGSAAAGTTVTANNSSGSGIGGSGRVAGGRKFTAGGVQQLQRSGGGAGQWAAGAAATTTSGAGPGSGGSGSGQGNSATSDSALNTHKIIIPSTTTPIQYQQLQL